MENLLPVRTDIEPETSSHSIVEITGEGASAVFQTLSNETARQIYITLDDEPRTTSGLASSLDKPLQNVLYHITSLKEAGLIRVVDIWYSSKGVEMKVYAPVSECLILVAGSGEIEGRVPTLL